MKRYLRFFYFLISIAVLVAALKTAHWLPTFLQPGSLRTYESFEEAKTGTRFDHIAVPSYFPQNLAWPPSLILAQGQPFPAIAMEFRDTAKGVVGLTIVQSEKSGFVMDEKIRIVRRTQEVVYPLKGRKALLVVGYCKDNEPCSSLTWDEEKYWVQTAMKSTPFEIIRIAESMVR